MTSWPVNILMYHSLSEGDGPTTLAPAVFREQMAALADLGYRGVSLAEFEAWRRRERDLGPRFVVLTFDDGFTDFATVAVPELARRGWSATVFLPAGRVGGDWEPGRARRPPRRVMSWPSIAQLPGWGIELGAHGVEHRDLTKLSPREARDEIVTAKRLIEDRTGVEVTSFAAPYGRTNRFVRAEVERHYRLAVGTRLAKAGPRSDLYDLPRIEMWYFRELRQWRRFLRGGWSAYFAWRQGLRGIRSLFPVPGAQ